MKTRTSSLAALLALAVLFSSCIGGGYDAQRLRNDADNHALASRCAAGWLGGQSFTELDRESVEKALAAWSRRLDADAKLLGVAR